MARHPGSALLALPLALASCGALPSFESNPAGTAPCPRIAILADGADLTRFRPGAGPDLTAMVLDARLTGFDARCDYAGRDRRSLDVRVTPRFAVERGPAFEGRVAELPWFVAMTDANDTALLERVAATTRVSFAANTPVATATGQPVRLTVPVAEGLRARDYTLRLSFQLTPEELALNRSRGPR
jgi:hypothetical protein